jgi:hypothetical protein
MPRLSTRVLIIEAEPLSRLFGPAKSTAAAALFDFAAGEDINTSGS